MPTSDLDNPIYASLQSRHGSLAIGGHEACRYPAEVAPFLGVAGRDVAGEAALGALVPPGDSVYLLGVAPNPPAGWQLQSYPALAQMICEGPLNLPDGPPMIPLDEANRADVLALTALVYPHYFRPHTMGLGRYFGIYVDGRLAAMIGERLGSSGTRELSAICTHPDFLGRGYARRLTAMLANHTLAQGHLPFLHVSYANPRAYQLYVGMGFRLRRDIGFWSLSRG